MNRSGPLPEFHRPLEHRATGLKDHRTQGLYVAYLCFGRDDFEAKLDALQLQERARRAELHMQFAGLGNFKIIDVRQQYSDNAVNTYETQGACIKSGPATYAPAPP